MVERPLERMTARLLAAIERHGLLLESDPKWPSLVALVVGAPVKGSWWSHPRGREIFAVSNAVADSGEAELVKLLAGKLTWVHRRLWPELHAVGSERAAWQTLDLPVAAARILEAVADRGRVRADDPTLVRLSETKDELRAAIAAVERRLLVHVTSEHTEHGRHERVLESWDRWADRVKLRRHEDDPAKARARLEAAAEALAAGAAAAMPWPVASPPDRRARGAPRRGAPRPAAGGRSRRP